MHSCKYSVSFLLRTVIHLKHRVTEFSLGLSAGGKPTGGQNSGPIGPRVYSIHGLLKVWS